MAKKEKKSVKRKSSSTALSTKNLAQIRLVLLDIDGILTDGRITWIEGTGWTASYSVLDGFGIRLLHREGIEVGFISGGSFTSHRKRAESLSIKHIYLGNEDKIGAYKAIQLATGSNDQETAYMGDELFDIPLLERVGFAATVPHAAKEVKKVSHYITKAQGGFGAAREMINLILEARKRKK